MTLFERIGFRSNSFYFFDRSHQHLDHHDYYCQTVADLYDLYIRMIIKIITVKSRNTVFQKHPIIVIFV